MDNYLVISALGKDRPGIVDDLSKAILDNDCNIVDSRMQALGGEFAIILMISGTSEAISQMEAILPGLESQLNLTIIAKRTEQRDAQPNFLPYTVDVVAMDHPGIVYQVANFFSSRNINIQDLVTDTYCAAHTGTPMFSLKMTIDVPADTHLADLRNQFIVFCEDFNVDAAIEPAKQ